MKELKFFNTYNQITKLFDVTVMTKQQINKLDNNKSFLVLTSKKHIDVVKPPRKPRSKQSDLKSIIVNTNNEVKTLRELILNIDNRLTQIVQANNLVDPTLTNKN